MAIVKRGSIVLIRYPFSDLSGFKVRPAVVVMSEALINKTDDILCIFISSVIQQNPLATDFVLNTNHPSFKNTGLKTTSIIRTHKLTLLHKKLVMRLLGEMDADIMNEINQRIKIALEL